VPYPEEWHARMSVRRTLVAEEGGEEVIGFAELEGDGYLDMLYVRGDAVGRGVGRQLYRALELESRSLGLAVEVAGSEKSAAYVSLLRGLLATL
jgi:GNAT superfamily N-acetyltransferase